jgi:hypothetical protein
MKQQIKLSFFLFFLLFTNFECCCVCGIISSKSWRSVSYLIWSQNANNNICTVCVTRIHHKLTFTPSGCSQVSSIRCWHIVKNINVIRCWWCLIHLLSINLFLNIKSIIIIFDQNFVICVVAWATTVSYIIALHVRTYHVPYWLRNKRSTLPRIYMNKAVRVWHPAEVRPLLLFFLYRQAQVIFKILR